MKPRSSQDPIYSLFKSYYEHNQSRITPNQAPIEPAKRVIVFDKVLCAFYGEAPQGSSAWQHDETCPVPDRDHLDPGYHQAALSCCGGGASSTLTAANLPAGIELGVDGGHFWSVDFSHIPPHSLWRGDALLIHTYCGPEPSPGAGCNVKLKIIGHYRIEAPGQELR